MRTPLAGRLERLSCAWVEVPPSTIRAWLERAPLRHLSFGVPEGSADGVGPLLGSTGLARLRQLHITGEDHGFGVDEMRRVAAWITTVIEHAADPDVIARVRGEVAELAGAFPVPGV